MKIPGFRPLLILACLAFLSEVGAAPVTRAQFRKFRGRYTGEVSGIAGNTGGTAAVGPFSAVIVVSTRRSEMLTPLIGTPFVSQRHRIVWRQPTGTAKRVILKGIYRGTFLNPYGVQMTVTGTRRVVLNDRGRTAAKRYAASLSDDLRETFTVTGSTSAGSILKGRFLK